MTYVPDYVRPVGPKSPISGPTTPTTPGHRRIESYTGNGTRSAPSVGVRDRTISQPRLSDDVISTSITSQRRRSASNPVSYTPSRPFKPPQDRLCSRMSIKDRLKSLESEAAVKLEVRHTSQRRQRRPHSHGSQRPPGSDKDRQSEDNSSVSSVNSIRTVGDTPEKMLETVSPMPKPDIIASNQPKLDVLPSKILPETDLESKPSKTVPKKVSKPSEEKKNSVKNEKNEVVREREHSGDIIDETPKPKIREKLPRREHDVPKYEKFAIGDKKSNKSVKKEEKKEQIFKSENSDKSGRKSTEYCSIDSNITNVPIDETLLPNLATERLHERPPETGLEVTKPRLSNENLSKDLKPESVTKGKDKGSNGPAFRPIWRTPSIKQDRGSRKNSTDGKGSDTKEELDSPNIKASEKPLENQIEPTPQLRPGFDKEQDQIDATVTLAQSIIASKEETEGSFTAKQPGTIALDESVNVTVAATVSTTTPTSTDVNIASTAYPVELRSPRHEHGGQALRRQNTRDKRNARVFVVPSSSDSDMDNSNQLSRMERDFAKLGLSRAVDLLPQNTATLPTDNNNHNPPKMETPEITIKHVSPVKFVPNLLKGNNKDAEKDDKKKLADEQSARIYPELLARSKKDSKSHDGDSKKDSQKSPNRRRKSTRSSRSGSSRSKSTDARRAGRDVQRNRSNSMCDPQRMRSGQEAVANAVAFGTSNGTAIPYIDDAVSPVEESSNETAKAQKSSSADEKKGQERTSMHRSNSADVLSSLVPETSPAKMRRVRASSVDRSAARGVHRRSYQIATMAHDGDPAYQQNLEKLDKLLMQAGDDESRDSSLGDQDATTRSGYLHFKVATIDKGRRTSSQKSWKYVWAILKDQQLCLSKDMSKSKSLQDSPLERQASLPEDVQSLNVQSSLVGIAYNYLKRRNVFKLTTFNGSEYLFQAVDRNDMIAWISAIQKQSYVWEDGTEGISEAILRKTNQIDPGPKSDKRNNRKRSPKPSQKNTLQAKDVDGSRRFKWRGSVNKIVKKFGTGQPFILNGTFGVHLEDCPPSAINEFVPFIVELCCRIVEERGLHFTGIYRVPGNNAALSALQDDLNNHGVESINADDERLKDLNVVSSLLKSFFRKLPEPMFTNELYHDFILANRSSTPESRLNSLRKLVHMLPGPHYETLKFLISHLRLVADNCESNKMEVRNLAIVFGPTLVCNTAADNATTMVTDMSDQCRIIESIIDHCDFFFHGEHEEIPAFVRTFHL